MNRAQSIHFLIAEERKKPMLTIAMLRSSTSQLNRKQGEPRPVSIHRTTPTVQNKTLTIRGEARGTKVYQLVVTFYNVDYSLERDGDHPLIVRPAVPFMNRDQVYMRPVSESSNPVQVRCSCLSFRHVWAHWDRENKSLAGAPFPEYIRKTTTRPEVNPIKAPGVCKHLIGFFERLGKDKILVG